MIFQEHSPGKMIVDEEILLEWKDKAKRYEDMVDAHTSQVPKKDVKEAE